MRKIYVKPEVSIVDVETSSSLLSASGSMGSAFMDFGDDAVAGECGDAKGHSSLWDFDEEE